MQGDRELLQEEEKTGGTTNIRYKYAMLNQLQSKKYQKAQPNNNLRRGTQTNAGAREIKSEGGFAGFFLLRTPNILRIFKVKMVMWPNRENERNGIPSSGRSPTCASLGSLLVLSIVSVVGVRDALCGWVDRCEWWGETISIASRCDLHELPDVFL